LADSKEVSVGNAKLLDGGTPISFNNLMDTNAAFELVKEFDEPAAVVVKHMNPCGCAVDANICKAYEKAYLGELTHQEISTQTGLPLGTIKSRIRLGLERLRHELKDLKQ